MPEISHFLKTKKVFFVLGIHYSCHYPCRMSIRLILLALTVVVYATHSYIQVDETSNKVGGVDQQGVQQIANTLPATQQAGSDRESPANAFVKRNPPSSPDSIGRSAADQVRRRLVAAAEAFVNDSFMGPLVTRLHVQRALSPSLEAFATEATWMRVKERGMKIVSISD
jgi:hypothetical protein